MGGQSLGAKGLLPAASRRRLAGAGALRSLLETVLGVLRGLHDLVSPWQCLACACRLPHGRPFCQECAASLARESREVPRLRLRQTREEAAPGPGTRPRPLAVDAAGLYRGTWARAVRAYKTDPSVRAGRYLESRVARAIPAGSWIVAPVPMAPVRRRERGVNPAETLARALAHHAGLPFRARLLRRVRYRRTNRGLDAAQRACEVEAAFAPGPELPSPGAGGQRPGILLIDDVLTTGATLLSCAHILEDAGFTCRALVLAWTPPKGKPLRRGGRFRYRLRRGSFAASVRSQARQPARRAVLNNPPQK